MLIQETEHRQQFLQHIKSLDSNIQFTVEKPGRDGSIPFLDTMVKPGPNNTIHTTENQHTDINTYTGRATTSKQPKTVFTTP